MKTLHVLNGDATLPGFTDAHIEGDFIVWREVMSEGPVEGDIYSRQFWAERSAFICENFHEAPENYQQKVLDETALLKNVSAYEEVVLWFEFDLHCQINFLAVLQLLQESDLSHTEISLVCPNHFPGVENFRGLGELNGEQLASLYPERLVLQQADLDFATEAWDAYASSDALRMREFLTQDFGRLPLLKIAFEAQLSRMDRNEEGLNRIEQKILDLWLNGARTKETLYKEFSKTEKVYGIGDDEFDLYIKKLRQKNLINL